MKYNYSFFAPPELFFFASQLKGNKSIGAKNKIILNNIINGLAAFQFTKTEYM